MTTPLPELAYELMSADGPEFQWGRGTDIHVRQFDDGTVESEAGTVPNPRADGVRFGRDYFRGRTLSWEGDIYTTRSSPGSNTASLELHEQFRDAWTPDEVRLTPNRVMALRMRRGGRIRRVFGRPGAFSSTSGKSARGWIPYVCTFKCVDHLYYDDTEYSEHIPMIPTSIGGLQGPLIGPIIASDESEGSGLIQIRGTKPSWLILRINAPIATPLVDPIVEVVDRWFIKLNTTLFPGQFIVIDPSPWNRYVRRNDGKNMSGIFTAQSARISSMQIPPGNNQVLLRGNDTSGTASIDAFWRDTYTSY